ncbi:MAG TPA: amidohydrolase family protein [Xanthobacteraceae bacterium]|jgi:aminocarboxymuconate-semialdehyde decarboxylase|nr:amidohydrolase family protein [Xanthobacteraceae bacterium]
MTKTRTIDSHTHILTQEAMRRLAKESPKVAPVLKDVNERDATLEIAGKVVQRPLPREIWDVALRLRDMDANQVDVQVLSPTVFTFFYDHDPALALACAMLQNEDIAAVVQKHPDRFLGLGSVPLQAPKAAADELTRGMTKLGLRGAMIGTHVNGCNLDDPALEPFWSAAAELGAFIFIHPHAGAAAERLNNYYLKNLVGLPFETTIAGASLVFGGVLERHPQLKICLSHGGGFVPYQAGRFQHGWKVRGEPKARIKEPPRQSLHRLYYDTILHSKPALEFLIGSVGPDHVLLGSDYPFDMGNLDCVARVKEVAIGAEAQHFILGGYARTLLGEARSNA